MSRSIHWLARAVCTETGAALFIDTYAWFRWVDDRIDVPDRDAATLAFVAAQQALLDGHRPAGEPAEQALVRARSSPLWSAVEPAVRRMWAALCLDAQRAAEPLPAAVLAEQVARVGESWLCCLWACAEAPGAPGEAALLLSRAATAAHHLRDLEEDLALGYINAPAEDIAALPRPLTVAGLHPWARTRAVEVEGWFAAGLADLDPMPWRMALAIRLQAWRYRRELRRFR